VVCCSQAATEKENFLQVHSSGSQHVRAPAQLEMMVTPFCTPICCTSVTPATQEDRVSIQPAL
jgi:hypothetical protein